MTYELLELRAILHETCTDLYVLLGQSESSNIGGWWRKRVEKDRPALEVFGEQMRLLNGELSGWEQGSPPNSVMEKRRKVVDVRVGEKSRYVRKSRQKHLRFNRQGSARAGRA